MGSRLRGRSGCLRTFMARTSGDSVNSWLAEGYTIVATDYQGLGTPGGDPWMVVKPEAYSVLDSVRSALGAFGELSNNVVIVGASQGAHAGLSASLLAKSYAPEVKLRGTVAVDVPGMSPYAPETGAPQIAVPPIAGGGANGALAVLSLFTLRAPDPSFVPSDCLSDDAKPVYEAARTGCEFGPVVVRNHVTVENAFKERPDTAIAKAAPLQQYPAPKFPQPVVVGAGLADTTTAPESQYNIVMAACYAGSTVEMHYYPGKNHNTSISASLPDSQAFVKKLLAGERIDGNCSVIKPPVPGN